LEENGVKVGRLFDLKPDPGLSAVIRGVGEHARDHFLKARKIVRGLPRQARSPALLAELGLLYLADLERAGWNPFILETLPGRRFAVANLAWRAFIGRY
jgi:phytoene synthase